ncbi:hypothetical protein [Halalkalibaculum sp. DA384]|uniref:hypothetical protein n=1 Tax=Halalkalibaculum sp. DA384 TaxID=3373606 RepID=UPI003754F732
MLGWFGSAGYHDDTFKSLQDIIKFVLRLHRFYQHVRAYAGHIYQDIHLPIKKLLGKTEYSSMALQRHLLHGWSTYGVGSLPLKQLGGRVCHSAFKSECSYIFKGGGYP